MFIPLIFITIISIIIFLKILTKPTNKNTSKSSQIKPIIPSPKGLPFIGNFHQFKPLATHFYFTELSQTYGPIFFLKLGSITAIVISSSNLAKEVLKNQDHIFCGRRALIAQQKLSYNGYDIVFSNYNRSWRELRKVCIIHLFSTKRVESYSSIRTEEVSWVLNEISTLSSSKKIVNLSELVVCMVISIVCRVGFGKNYKNNEEKYKRSSDFYGMLNRAQHMFMSLFFKDYFPCLGWIDWISGASRRLQKVFDELDGFYQEVIHEHMDPNRVKPDQEDIVDVLLRLNREGDGGIEITFDHIKAVLMNIFIAGTETTIATIIWTMTYLMKNPNTMNKAQQELRTFIKQHNYTTFIQEEHLKHLPYLQAIIKETHRINSIVPLSVPHQTLQKCTLEGFEIEAGTLVFVNIWAIGRDPNSWKDPDVFFPERFLDGDCIEFNGNNYDFIPFGAGRRICPGMLMGNATVELALANMLCWFDWDVIDGMRRDDIDMDVLPGITVPKKNDLCLYAKKYV